MEHKPFGKQSKGGKARARKLSKQRRVEIAVKAAQARWSRRKNKPSLRTILVVRKQALLARQKQLEAEIEGISHLIKLLSS